MKKEISADEYYVHETSPTVGYSVLCYQVVYDGKTHLNRSINSKLL